MCSNNTQNNDIITMNYCQVENIETEFFEKTRFLRKYQGGTKNVRNQRFNQSL